MEGNKDEALRCIELAVAALTEGKISRAEKFLKKAESLYPTSKAKVLLDKIKSIPSQEKSESDGSHLHFRKNTGASNNIGSNESRTTEPDYTSEQEEAVKRIKRCKDYYEILGVTKESSDSEIKKAYKKQALVLHPDKNKAPGSVEAFKAIGNAVAILTDPQKRKLYDLHGNDASFNPLGGGQQNSMGRRNFNEYAYTRGFESDVTAEELFNMFFGGAFQQPNTFNRQRQFRQREYHREREQPSYYSGLINLLPILLLVGLSMMSSFFISDPYYQLQPSHKFSVQRRTSNLKITYYVKDNFHTEYQGSVNRLEIAVEEDFLNHLRHQCSREKAYKDAMVMKARNFGDKDLYRKSQTMNMPSCESLQKYANT